MLAACLPTNIKYCYAVEDASDTISPPPKRFICPIKCPKIKWPEFSWNKVGTESLNDTIDPIIHQDNLTPKPLALVGKTCDNSPEVIIKLKPSCSKTEESEFDEPNPTSFLIAGDRSESFKKIELDGIGSFVEHKEGPLYDPAPIPSLKFKLQIRTASQKIFIVAPEDSTPINKGNKRVLDKLSQANYEYIQPLTGSDAFAAIVASGLYPDAVLSDISMPQGLPELWLQMLRYAPGMEKEDSGVILAQALRNIGYTGPIVATSASPEDIKKEHRHLFTEIRGKLTANENIKALLSLYGVRSPTSKRFFDILKLSSGSSKS
jgi:CheY-like chemotaxis protein